MQHSRGATQGAGNRGARGGRGARNPHRHGGQPQRGCAPTRPGILHGVRPPPVPQPGHLPNPGGPQGSGGGRAPPPGPPRRRSPTPAQSRRRTKKPWRWRWGTTTRAPQYRSQRRSPWPTTWTGK